MKNSTVSSKQAEVNQLVELIKKAQLLAVFEYLGLTVSEMVSLRKKLYPIKAQVLVVKNNILNRALNAVALKEFGHLVGPNALLLGFDAEFSSLKALVDLSANFTFVKLKGAYVEKTYLNPQESAKISTRPNKTGMLAMLLTCLQNPMQKLTYLLKTISKGK